MMKQTQISKPGQVPSQVIIPRDYEVFAGLDVDKHSIAVTFCNHEALLRSVRLPYSAAQLLNFVRQHFPRERMAFAYEAGPTGFGLYDEMAGAGHRCLVVVPQMVPRAGTESEDQSFGAGQREQTIVKHRAVRLDIFIESAESKRRQGP